jgi:hypothetical protein
LTPNAARDLVPHRREAVFDVIALGIARAPELVQVAGHRARRAHDDVARTSGVVHRADDLALRRERRVSERVKTVDLLRPLT